ncbi:trichohyalin isoform X2 [Neoarius graeffei]|nr:trichohyalin isoform X2 [Neoarius graeffei]
MVGDDVAFLCHGEDEIAKILWKNGEAVGFYSVKPEGRLCNSFLTQCYQLPVMDTIFIRKCHRGNGHGLQMLEDFVDNFRKDFMGLKYPLPPAMYKVCKKYLSLYPEDTELLWETEGVGSPFQRTQITRKLQAMDLKEDNDIPMEVGITQVQETMEVVEDVAQIKVTEELQDTPVTPCGRSSNLKQKNLGADKEETTEKNIRVEDREPDECAEDDPVHEEGKLTLNLKDPELKDTMGTCDIRTIIHVTPISEITQFHCEEPKKLTPTLQSETEKEQVVEIIPVMDMQSLNGNEDVQIMKTFETTIVPVHLQPLEPQQVVEVEIVKMLSETEEVKEKAVEVKEMKDDVDQEIPVDGRETSEEMVKSQKDKRDMAETTNKEDIEDEAELRKISVVKNIVDDTEEIEVKEKKAGPLEVPLVEKEQSEQVKEKDTVEETGTVQECLCEKEQETEDQEPSPHNEEEKVSTLIQREENSNMAYRSGSKGKHDDKRRSNYETPLRHSRRLNDQAAESELAEKVLRSSSKKTLKATSKQVYARQTKSIKQVGKITEDNEGIGIVDANNTETPEVMIDGKASEPSSAENIEEQEEEPASETVPAEDDNTEAGLKWKNTSVTLVESTEKQVMEMTDNENVAIEDKITNSNIEGTEERHYKTEIEENIASKDEDKVPEPTITDENKKEDAQEEEPVKEPNTIHSDEPKINDIESNLDYKAGKANKDGEKIAVIDVHDAEDINADEMEVEGKVPEESVVESFVVVEQEEEPASEMVPTDIVQNTEEATSPLKRQKAVVVLVNLDKVSTTHTNASEGTKGTSQSESTDDTENKEAEGLNQKVKPTEKEQKVEMTEIENVTVEVVDKSENSSIKEPEEMMETEERVITTDADRVSELTTDENKMEAFQEKKALEETKTVQATPDEESKDIIKSSEDDEGVKSDGRHSRRLKHQAAERELTKRVLRSSAKAAKAASKLKAIKQQVKTNQAVDDPEVEKMKEVLESHSETVVDEKIESVSITTEMEHVKAVEIEFEVKTPEQSAVEPVEEQEEEPASGIEPVGDITEEATSDFKLQKVSVVLEDFDKVSKTHIYAGKDTKGTLQPQKEVDAEFHILESTDTVAQAERTEKEQAVEMTENKIENSSTEVTDEKVEIKEGVVLNDEHRLPHSVVTDEENTEDAQKEIDTAQEIPAEEPKSLQVIESSEADEGERLDIPIKLDEGDEDETSSVTPLRCSKSLKDQAVVSELTKRVLRSSERLRKKATPQQRQKLQIKTMMVQEEPEQRDESKDNDMNIMLGCDAAVGEHMESETVHVFAEGDSDVIEQDKMAAENIMHGEPEQICTSGEKLEKVENKVQEDGAPTEMGHGENSENIIETTSALTLQEASVMLVDVRVLPSLTGDCSSAFETAQEEIGDKLKMSEQAVDMPEKVKEELQTGIVEGENIKPVIPTEGDLNTAAKDTAEEDNNVVKSNLEIETTDTSKLEKEKCSDESKVEQESKAEKFTLQVPILTQASVHEKCSETTTCVQNILNLYNTEVVEDNNSVEEQEEELATELTPGKDSENAVESTSMLKLHKAAVVLVDFCRKTGGNETTQSQEVELLSKAYLANEEKALIEMDVAEPVAERIQEEAVELGIDNTLISNDEQDRDIHAEQGVKDDFKEVEDTTLREKSKLAELDTNKTLKECQESTTPAQGDSVQESTQVEDILVYTSKNLSRRTLPVKTTPERVSSCHQHVYKETKVNENREEQISGEEIETVFTRHLRGRTIRITPRRRSKHRTGAQVAEPEMEGHVTSHEIIVVQSTEEARTAVEETHETHPKYGNEEVPAIFEASRKDQQQDKSIPENDAEKMEEVTDGRKDMAEEAVDHKEVEPTDREILVEGDLPDENQEKEEPEESNQEQVRSENFEQERDQQDNALEETLLEKTFEKELCKRVEEKHLEEEKDGAMNISITEAVLDQSEEGVSVERRALRKRSITIKVASVRKSKRLCKQDQGENDGQTVVWANTEDSVPVEATVMEMAAVKSPAENEHTDQRKSQEIEDTNTIGGEISHKDEDQEDAKREETYGNANSQEVTMTEDASKQAQFLNMSEDDTDVMLVVQEEEKGEENREEQSTSEEIMKSENNAVNVDNVSDEPKFEDIQEELEQNEENAEEMSKVSVTVDENFTLEANKEVDSNDTECNQLAEETKASFQESEKEITDAEQESGVLSKRTLQGRKSAAASPEQRSTRRNRRLLQDSDSEMEDKLEVEEVKEVIGEEQKKLQQKRKAIAELTPRRSKRLARADIM